jgi:transcriptional regulator with XRE-family HTH domain
LKPGWSAIPAFSLPVDQSLIWDIFPYMEFDIDHRLAAHIHDLRIERSWSLDDLASASGLSRATLSRIENVQVSPTASVLGKLCAAFGVTMSRLLALAEQPAEGVTRRAEQTVWSDPDHGFVRWSVSPSGQGFDCELVDCQLQPDTHIPYDRPARPGLEHHLYLLEGRLAVTVDGRRHNLETGDSLRYRLFGASVFDTPPDTGARYVLAVR